MEPSSQTATLETEGRRIALLVGVNEAPRSLLPALQHAEADAQAMAEVLMQYGQFTCPLPPLLGEQATSGVIKQTILSLLRDCTDKDSLLLYFSGHGVPLLVKQADQPDADLVFLATSDFCESEAEDDPTLHLSQRWLRDYVFNKARAHQVLIVLDCCYAGDLGHTGPNPQLQEVLQRLARYFDLPGAVQQARLGGMRLALLATGHQQPSEEHEEHGVLTGPLLRALRGAVDSVLGDEGQLTFTRLFDYLYTEMPPGQKPSFAGDAAGQSYILAYHPERVADLQRERTRVAVATRPTTYIPFPRNSLFQERPGEFERLEALLFGSAEQARPKRLGLVGVIGLGGVGKTQLAVELAYRSLEQKCFPAGIFWTPATGTTLAEWQHQLAELAYNGNYLPEGDDPSRPDNEAQRARHLCRYLAEHRDALLILDNVDATDLISSALPALAGGEVGCALLYTSRQTNRPRDVTLYTVDVLPEAGALQLLLETTRPQVITTSETGQLQAEVQAARTICQRVGCLPLALVHLRSLLERDPQVTLVRLLEVLSERGALELAKTQLGDAAPLFATFALSWERVQSEEARRLFRLACYFPEATPIPLWLLGVASGLGERGDIFEPLGQARLELQELSLLEALTGNQVRLHPLVRSFGRFLSEAQTDRGEGLREEALNHLLEVFADLNHLEQRAIDAGFPACLEQVQAALLYAELLGEGEKIIVLEHIERWLDRESYLFRDERWWPNISPGLFYQQIFNNSVEEGVPIYAKHPPSRWIRQLSPVGVRDEALIRIFFDLTGPLGKVAFSPDGHLVLTGSSDHIARLWETSSGQLLRTFQVHTGMIYGVAFSPDGHLVLTGSWDNTARLWETSSGKLLHTLRGGDEYVESVAFSPDGHLVLTGSWDNTARLWETSSGKLLRTLKGHTNRVSSVAFSPDGHLALTGSWDTTARLWEIRSGQLLHIFKNYPSGVTYVVFSPDGHFMVICNSLGLVFFWENGEMQLEKPLGIYSAGFEVGSVHWLEKGRLLLADKGVAIGRSHIYPLALEGML